MGIGPNEKVRIGIIGCGGIANGKHMPSLSKLKNIEMVAFCDIIEERAIEAKKKYGLSEILFGINVAGNMAAAVNDQAAFSFFGQFMGKNGTIQTCADDEIIVHGVLLILQLI